MKLSFTTPAINRTILLLLMLFAFTVGKAQNLLPYQIDTTFVKKINSLSEDGKYRSSSDVLEKRIYETAQSNAFFDFDYAFLNYFRNFNKAGYSKEEKENILHRMYHLLPQLKLEYAYVLGSYIRNRFDNTSLFSMYAESKEWKLKDEIIKFEEPADLKRIQNETDEIAQKGLIHLMNYQYPHTHSKNYTYLDHFFSFETGIELFPELYQLLFKYHQKNAHQYELIQLELSTILVKNHKDIQNKWNDFDSLYRIYVAVPESEWILSEMYKTTKHYTLEKNCSLKSELITLLQTYSEQFDAKQGSIVDVIYHQLINPEFSIEFNELGLNNKATTFSIKAKNLDTIYYNIYSYEDAFTEFSSKNKWLTKDKMKLVSARILLVDKNAICFTEKYFLQEKLEESDNYIFAWTDNPAFFDSLTNYYIDSLSSFNFQLRVYTFDKFIAHKILNEHDDAIHLLNKSFASLITHPIAQ
jgi:hypothetical protein